VAVTQFHGFAGPILLKFLQHWSSDGSPTNWMPSTCHSHRYAGFSK